MDKKGEYVKLKNFERKIKSPFMIYANFQSIIAPEDKGKQNPEESYTNKYQNHNSCSYGYRLVCLDDNFSKPFKSYFGQDDVYNFINSMIEKSRYYTDMKTKHFNIKLVMTKEGDKDFENSTKCWICDNVYVDGGLK